MGKTAKPFLSTAANNRCAFPRKFFIFLSACVFALYFICLFPATADDSNGGAGSEGQHQAASGGYYLSNQWGWRVSLYVAKDMGLSEEEYKSLSLTQDYHYVGTTNLVCNGFDVSESTYFGTQNKLQYIDGALFTFQTGMVYWNCDCPAPPACCYGNIDTVNDYFLNNELLLYVLDRIAEERGVTASDLINVLTFEFETEQDGETVVHTYTGRQLGYRNVLPLKERENYLPWVIVYEPMICTYFADGVHSAFLTATEYSQSQSTAWNWCWNSNQYCYFYGKYYPTAGKTPQNMQLIAFQRLPKSVMLQESWFGFETGNSSDSILSYDLDYILHNGGWGMGYLSAIPYEELTERLPDEVDLRIEAIKPNGDYISGYEVISGFYLINGSDETAVYPDDGVYVVFKAVNESTGEIISRQIWDNIALPTEERTVIWFRWKIIAEGGEDISYSAEIIIPEGISDISYADNYAEVNLTVAEPPASDTSSFGYSDCIPDDFVLPEEPEEAYGTLSWVQWYYGDDFYCVKYTVSSGGCRAEISPDESISSVKYSYGNWTVRSGYGFYLEAYGEYTEKGVESIPAGSVTRAQSCTVTFPEYGYSGEYGNYCTAEYTGECFEFAENSTAIGEKRLHYIPIWYPDSGEGANETNGYSVMCIFSQMWTPVGMLSASVVTNGFAIDGSMYDDWRVSPVK